MLINVIEIRSSTKIRIGIDILIPDLKEVDIILWNWEGVYGIIPKPVIQNAIEFIKIHYPTAWNNGKENRIPALVSVSKNRPREIDFVWEQVREIEPYVAQTLMGM